MAGRKKKETMLTGRGLLDDLSSILDELQIREGRTYRPVPTGLDVLDYYNGRFFYNHESEDYDLFLGIPIGKLISIIGYTGCGKTTLAVQMAMSLVSPYERGSIFHFDLENAYSSERVCDITGCSQDVVAAKYKRFDPCSLDKIYSFIKKVRETKLKLMKDDPDIWVLDEASGEQIPIPTVILVDTVAALQSEAVMNEKTEMGSLMYELGAQAKANNSFAQRLAGIIGEPNITVIAVNHIRADIQDGPVRKAKKIQYLAADETLPGGTGFPQYSDYMLKLNAVESLKTDEGFSIIGKIIRGTIIKSRLSHDGRQFELVFSDNGFDNDWTNLNFLRREKLLKGAGGNMFIEAPDGRQTRKFAMKNFCRLYSEDQDFFDITNAMLEHSLLKIVPKPGHDYETASTE
jgi:RecA/RadA recombinase